MEFGIFSILLISNLSATRRPSVIYWLVPGRIQLDWLQIQSSHFQQQGMGNCQQVSDITLPTGFEGILINCRAWKKTYSNLYDYSADSDQYTERNLTLSLQPNQCRSLVKVNQQFNIVEQPEKTKTLENSIFNLINKNQNYIIEPSLNLQRLTANQIWLAVKSTPSNKYKLKEGDMLRIGNQKIKVKEIIFEDNQTEASIQVRSNFKVYENTSKEDSKGYDPQEDTQQPTCRICLEEGEINNPLLAPCKCSGSAKFIHIKCIQQWFNKLINPRKVNASIIISWKPLICELCNQSLPFKIYIDGVKHFTVNIPRPERPYIVLNPMTKEKTNTKIYHLVSFSQKKSLTIGRKKEADVVFEEEGTVSRFHSVLQYQQKDEKYGKITISDKDSKFGTLVLLKKAINISSIASSLTLQFGGNIVTLCCKLRNPKFAGNPEQEINQQQKSTSTQSLKNGDTED